MLPPGRFRRVRVDGPSLSLRGQQHSPSRRVTLISRVRRVAGCQRKPAPNDLRRDPTLGDAIPGDARSDAAAVRNRLHRTMLVCSIGPTSAFRLPYLEVSRAGVNPRDACVARSKGCGWKSQWPTTWMSSEMIRPRATVTDSAGLAPPPDVIVMSHWIDPGGVVRGPARCVL